VLGIASQCIRGGPHPDLVHLRQLVPEQRQQEAHLQLSQLAQVFGNLACRPDGFTLGVFSNFAAFHLSYIDQQLMVVLGTT
jgi:hypothetical protein